MNSNSNILITGSSGLIGKQLQALLNRHGYDISVLSVSKTKKSESKKYLWDPDKEIMDPLALKEKSVIINLAGESISGHRWTTKYKEKILNSRLKGLNLMYETLKRTPNSVKTLISASAVGYYGNTGEAWMEEDAGASKDFLGETCILWEQAAKKFENIGIRVVILRIGVVLSRRGGALPELARPVKFFAGTSFGSGRQFVPWIHIRDLMGIFLQSILNEQMSGSYNAVAPQPVTNREFIKSICHELHRPYWPVRIPSFLLRLILGERAMIILHGQRVASKKISQAGYKFIFPELKSALQNLYSSHETGNRDLLVPA